ncbi:MAG: tetratricopeptide repeat protein [Bacteroidetes bacterium]|nr:tetratricopeptide repeat protein [Bacteroidota bacterium]
MKLLIKSILLLLLSWPATSVWAQQTSTGLKEADSLYAAGAFKESLVKCRELLKTEKPEEEIRLLMAKCWFSLNNPLELFAELDQLNRINPCYPEALALAGLYLFKQKEYKQARKKYYLAINCSPQTAEYHFDAGIVESKLYRWKTAIENFDRAIQLKKNYAEAFEARAYAHSMSKSFKLAIRDYDSALFHSPGNPDLYVKRGLNMISLGQSREAEQLFSRAIRLDSTRKSAWYSRGRVRLEMRHFNNAIADFNRVLELDAEDELALFSKGVCLLEINKRENLEQACDCFKKAAEKNLGQAWDFFRQYCTR